MSIICDQCDKHICIENPEKCNPNMTAAEKIEAISENPGKMKCICESEAIHESREIGGVNVKFDIDLKGEKIIRILATEQEPPEPFFDSKVLYQKPLPRQIGYAIVCENCPVCGRKLKGERDDKNES